ncbi:MAG: aminoacetone oxidase family FAD-binding enzyme [Bacilli bacterium]
MRIAVIGGGASGLYGAIALKKRHPEAELFVYEKEEKIARKLYATGNGHCNLLNAAVVAEDFNNPAFIAPYLKRYPFAALKQTLASWGIMTLREGDYVYPLSYNAGTYVGFLTDLATSLGVHFFTGVRVLDYSQKDGGFVLKTDAKTASMDFAFDKIVFASGGLSTPKLGSDGSLFPLLAKRGYSLVQPLPGLAPIKVAHPEMLKGLSGYRHDAKVSLLSKEGKLLYTERGEVLFKEDGLSGIVVFNVESVYCRLRQPVGATISLDFFPDETRETLAEELKNNHAINPLFYGEAYFPKEVQDHFTWAKNSDHFLLLAQRLKNDGYLIKATYGFDHSQVTVGGVSITSLKPSLESIKEPGVYFLGEVLDLDGFCGGFNLTWALLSALIVRDSL